MPRSTSTYNTKRYNCLHCSQSFSTQGGLTKHRKSTHNPAQFLPPSTSARDLPSASASQHPEGPFENVQEHGGDLDGAVPPVVESSQYHPFLNTIRYDQDGHPVPKNAPPGPSNADNKDWKPFQNRVAFELGEFLYKEEQMSQRKINKLLELWAASLVEHGATPPYTSQQQMYDTIDTITVGDVPWETFSLKYSGEVPDGVTPSWMLANYEIHFRDPHLLVRQQLNNPAFKDGFDPIPRRDLDCKAGRKYDKDPVFQKFRWQLFHKFLAFVMHSLKPGMTTKQLVRCPDGYYRYVIYCLGPYIANYPEQALLTGIPFTNNFPRTDIHELIAPDLLHQIIKGTFKDHLVTWVGEYLTITHGKVAGNAILDDIDRRIAAAPSFPGLRRFPEGRRFKQWTGDDSKALMK
ncbi:hypothetical protein PHLCEN_2v8003, partial [Hermanssonia centrifuga]